MSKSRKRRLPPPAEPPAAGKEKAKGAGKPSISAVLPAYNEEANIRPVTEELRAALAKHCERFEIIIVDDGSKDATGEIADRLAEEHPEVRVIHHRPNKGYGVALKNGFLSARMPLVFYTDSDGQFVADEIHLLTELIGDADIVTGYRANRQDPWLRKFFSWGFKKFIGLIFGVHVRDCDCAFKLYRRRVFDEITIDSTMFFVDAEVLAKANVLGYTIDEVAVTHRPRAGGRSTVRLTHILTTLREAFHMMRRPNLPLRLPEAKREP
jgi:glycosyltransferase involved in cell wall biosynthesis